IGLSAGVGPSQSRQSTEATDTRLTARVSVSEPGALASRAVDSLGKAAGVPLRCSDPAIARYHVELLAHHTPLRDVMQELASFLAVAPGACTWAPATIRGDRGYNLRQDARSRTARGALQRTLQKRRAQ